MQYNVPMVHNAIQCKTIQQHNESNDKRVQYSKRYFRMEMKPGTSIESHYERDTALEARDTVML